MNQISEFSLYSVPGVSVASTPKGLKAIKDDACAAAIWRRQPLKTFQDWIDSLAPTQLPRARMILCPELVHQALSEIVEVSGLPASLEQEMLVDDISALAHMFSSVMETPYLRLRLDVINNNACRKFHTDAVKARLVCTYRGTGTQYGIATQLAEPACVFTVPTSSPILLRGTLWPTQPASSLRHRSPQIEGTGQTRLVLVLDPVLEPDDEPHPKLIH